MPAYHYKCPHCGAEADVQLSVEEVGNTIVACTGRDNRLCDHNMQRVFTPPAIHFKGSGFYSRGG